MTAEEHLAQTIERYLNHRLKRQMAARDSQFERLLAWARKVSEKTGIPLENL